MSQNKETFLQNNLFFAEVKQMLDENKSVRIRVRGNSMSPFIRHNDAVLLEPAISKKIRKGAIVIARTDELGYVMHRVVKISGEEITLLGDGNVNQFEHTDYSRVLAIVTRYDRGTHSFSTESLIMRTLGLLWIKMHPWRKTLICSLWNLTLKTKNRINEIKK